VILLSDMMIDFVIGVICCEVLVLKGRKILFGGILGSPSVLVSQLYRSCSLQIGPTWRIAAWRIGNHGNLLFVFGF
jgi:hypothetical protein